MTPFQRHRANWNTCNRCALCSRRTRVVLCRGTVPCDVMFVGEAPGVSEDLLNKPFAGPAGKLLDKIIKEAWDRAGKPQVGQSGSWQPSQATYCLTNLVGCIPKAVPPVVVNMKHDAFDLRIDRKSDWGNPFFIGKDGTRAEVIEKYREWILTRQDLLERIPRLENKRLGCHCAPKPCHGDVLVSLFMRYASSDKVSEPPEWAIKQCASRLDELMRICKPKVVVAVGRLAARHLGKKSTVTIVHPAAIMRADVSQQGLAIQQTIVTLSDVVSDIRV